MQLVQQFENMWLAGFICLREHVYDRGQQVGGWGLADDQIEKKNVGNQFHINEPRQQLSPGPNMNH